MQLQKNMLFLDRSTCRFFDKHNIFDRNKMSSNERLIQQTKDIHRNTAIVIIVIILLKYLQYIDSNSNVWYFDVGILLF